MSQTSPPFYHPKCPTFEGEFHFNGFNGWDRGIFPIQIDYESGGGLDIIAASAKFIEA
jgi:hypothetical protein